MKKYTKEQTRLYLVLINLEKQIWDTFENNNPGAAPRFPICNDDWTDAHQEYLEWKWAKEEFDEIIKVLDEQYQNAQKDYFKSINVTRKIKTAKEYYDKQKDFENTVAYYKEHHINGM